jgi:hypothetical protein
MEASIIHMIIVFISGVVVAVSAMITAVVQIWKMIRKAREELGLGQKQLEAKVDQAANKAEEVKNELNRSQIRATKKIDDLQDSVTKVVLNTTADQNIKIDALASKTDDIHVMVNGKMAMQLKLNMDLARKLAQTTGEREDQFVADTAEQVYRNYMANQAVVEAGALGINIKKEGK